MYDGVPSTHYWAEFAKYAKIGLVRAEILPIFLSCMPTRHRAIRETDPNMSAPLLVLIIGRDSHHILKLAYYGREFGPFFGSECPRDVKIP